MSSVTQVSRAAVAAAFLASLAGCSEEPSGSPATTSHSAAATAQTTAAATAAATVTAAATATAAATEKHDCPKGSTGDGTFKVPCDAKGKDRMMEVTWTGKMDDSGPSFRVVNKSTTLTILFGKIVVYFYDKAGKPIELKDDSGKARPNHVCSGNNLFGGVMKPGEKAVVTFSCVGKKVVPDGAAAIEGEIQMVGFADATEKKSEYFWRNNDLTPDARPKGGIK